MTRHPTSILLALLVLAACRSTIAAEGATPAETGSRAQADSADASAPVGTDPGGAGYGTALEPKPGNELAAFAAGCFWGVEDAYRHVPGVTATAVGYSGGHTKDPTYAKVCAHDTGHAETLLVEFDPAKVSYERLVDVFFQIHDPTTVNRQGPDVGDQYRSAVFTFSPAQDAAARAAMKRAEARLGAKVVTEIQPISPFYKAEEYHQQYAEKTGSHGCPINMKGLTEGT